MADKQWTMNCILAGARVGKLLGLKKYNEAKDYLRNLTSELTLEEIAYLMDRVDAVLAGAE